MKKIFGLLIGLAMVAGFSVTSFAAITGSSHDLSNFNATRTDQLCIYCHTPHNGGTTAPLWNHFAGTTSFTLYSGSTGNVTGSSVACLSCHDGVTGIDAFGTFTTGTAMTGVAALGTDLQNDHPVSVAYPSTGDFNAASGNTIGQLTLESGNVECGSCHDPHDDQFTKFLEMDNAGSDLCLECHNK